MALPTSADFSAETVHTEMMIEIFFTGVPLQVTSDNYLIECSWLEEDSSDIANLLGAPSSNEFSFSMFNESSLFTPTNQASPYYNQIVQNMKIIPYIRTNNHLDDPTDWLKLGEYFMTKWETTIVGQYVSVTANDRLYNVFTKPIPIYPVQRQTSVHDFVQQYFSLIGESAIVSMDTQLQRILPYVFVDSVAQTFLQEILNSSFSIVSTNKDGLVRVSTWNKNAPIVNTLYDDSQVINVNATQSAIKSYGGIDLTYVTPDILYDAPLLNMSSEILAPGITRTQPYSLNQVPAYYIAQVAINSQAPNVTLESVEATPLDVLFTLNNPGVEYTTCSIDVLGAVLSLVESKMTDNSDRLLTIKNRYIQSMQHAANFKATLENFIKIAVPTLDVPIRGDCTMNVGECITVISDTYGITFTGFIRRLTYTFNGTLSCTMSLLNKEVLA